MTASSNLEDSAAQHAQILAQLAAELQLRPPQIAAAVELLDGGATVPFIARYRKEATGGMSDEHLRNMEVRLAYLRELEQRRAAILKSIASQGKLSPPLQAAILAASQKQELEDLYLPYKPRVTTRAQKARSAGLEPLADVLFSDPTRDPLTQAQGFVQASKGEDGADFTTAQACLDGARDILVERWAEDSTLVGPLREWLWSCGVLRAQVREGKTEEGANFRDYFEYAEPMARVPSHRALAVFRGRTQDVLDLSLQLPDAHAPGSAPLNAAQQRIAQHIGWSHQARAADDWLQRCVQWAWRVKLSLSLERELFGRLREQAEAQAISVFGANLRDLLLAAPAGPKTVMGLDPGIRTGVKVAVTDPTGKVLETATVYPHEPRRDWDGSLHTLATLCSRHRVQIVSIGNGTASRETTRLVSDLARRHPELALTQVVVSEAGASVYSASELATQELPELDVSLRGAVSIARRVQDPLAELVKIDPKSIGVGQYQHDVDQAQLARRLDAVVEDCVNRVGVDVNTASRPLLARVAGLSARLADHIVRQRDANGAFRSRQSLLAVPGLGAKTFEQAAGFLRIMDGDNPLDRSAVHPESYPLVERILAAAGQPIDVMMGNAKALQAVRAEAFVDAQFGLYTVRDVLAELDKPGRDPRPAFRVAQLQEDVQKIQDLRPGMRLEGTVTNVAAFGAFVDLGVHCDGLVHVSQLADRFVKDASDVVKVGDIVNVTVLEVDVQRQRIGLSMRSAQPGAGSSASGKPSDARLPAAGAPANRPAGKARQASMTAPAQSAMAAAFSRLGKTRP
ncbi:Tex family protein [Thiomonas sp. FB-Cd]|uniref:Tex family protein n=1 Tax=Thiomonas sp. FB-Cd TaxID=1158292 RepID=UPI00056DA0A2|nr:Tex family protein [Thiomonas sp. FB-Cd]